VRHRALWCVVLAGRTNQRQSHAGHFAERDDQICQQCTVTADRDIACVSLDCPVYFERVKAAHRVETAHALLDAIADLESSL